MYYLHFRYVYSFYSDGELMLEDVLEERHAVSEGARIVLHDQEDGSFLLSGVKRDMHGEFVVLTYPNKDNLCVYLDRSEEFDYDEYYSAMRRRPSRLFLL